MLKEGISELNELTCAAERDVDEVLMRAYPDFGEEVDEDVYFAGYDALRDARIVVHKLMRISVEARQGWLVEVLEPKREHVAAQLAYLERIGRGLRH